LKFAKQPKQRIYIVPTRYGILYGLIVLTLLVTGTAFDNSSLFFAAGLLMTFGLVCMHQTHFNVASVKILEVEPSSGFSGETVSWKLRIANHTVNTAFSINIRDALVDVPARETLIENMPVILRKRGRVLLKELKISSTYPLGLFYAWKWWEGNVHYFVYPAIKGKAEIFRHLDRAPSELDSREDFLGHRLFVSGDSAHHIDWKLHARRMKAFVKLFDTHLSEVVKLKWDDTPAGGREEKLSYLSTAVNECHKLQRPFSLSLPGIDIPAGQTRSHARKCLQRLSTFEAEDEVA
jgi:uncharacterized protein (DUF58 family)